VTISRSHRVSHRVSHRLTGLLTGLLTVAAIATAGCASDPDAAATTPGPTVTATADTPTASGSPETPTATPTDTTTAPPAFDEPGTAPVADRSHTELAELGVNELGRVLVMEWHALGDTDGRWENSLDTFRAQLRELYDKGFRPISVAEFIEGTFPIPAGTAPVLLTFDDSYKSHMYFGDDGETPAPDSVVGILEEMEREDPTWRARAHFAFYWPAPFREPDRDVIARKMTYLVEQGYDLSNHSYGHESLAALPPEGVRETLAKSEMELQTMVPGYRIRSLTLPFGEWPDPRDDAVTGTFEGHTYEHDIVLQVGFMPTRSPHHAEYDPLDVHRVQAYLPEFRKWMDWLEEDPSRRYVSDGDPSTVTYPASFADVAAPQPGFETRVYE
jgi:peptidoglycan/xylan/chitin deacetylase (PgdA/CDA1 family)